MSISALPTASTVVDSILFRDAFGTAAMRTLFSDQALIQRYIDVEVALAKAEARVGVIPAEAAVIIARESTIDRIDFEHMRHETDIVGYPILPLVHQLVGMCGEAGRYVHWGATTQDIMDTAVALQVRDALDIVGEDVRVLRQTLADLALKHRDTPMAGRTHLQQALPITFGYKAAIWLAMFDRHQQRLSELRPRVAVVGFGGAAGTLASLGEKGFEVQRALAEELNLDGGAVKAFLGGAASDRADLDPLLLPTPAATLIHGELDTVVPIGLSRTYAGAHPGCGFVELSNTAHFELIDPRGKAWPVVIQELQRLLA